VTGGVPDAFWIGSAAALGGVIGSFLNVCIYRMPRRCMSIAHPAHSRCPKCGHGIRWYENIPVLSWIALRGRCSSCRSPISPFYPAIEGLTALIFAMAAKTALEQPAPWVEGVLPPWGLSEPTTAMRGAWFAVAAGLSAAMIVATFVDFEFQIIPDQVSVTGAWIAPLLSLAFPWLHRPVLRLYPDAVMPPLIPGASPHLEALAASLIGAAVGAGSIWAVGIVGKIVFRKEAMGFGDVKLMAFVGGILGWKASLFVFLIACFVGSAVGIAQLLTLQLVNLFRKHPARFDHYLAFGPYLAVGALAMFFFYRDIDFAVFVAYPAWLRKLAGVG